jgi:hypothetical protein
MQISRFLSRRARAYAPCAIFAAAGLAQAVSADVIDVRWLTNASGTWNTPTRWSTGVSPYNNSPAGTTYRVTIDATGSNYTATLNDSALVDLLTINSANASLSVASGSTLNTVNGIELRRGNLRLNGGTVRGTIRMLGGTMVGSTGAFTTFDGVSITGTTTVGGLISVRNGLNVEALTFNGSSALLQFRGDQSITGGSLTIGLNASQVSAEGATTLTVAPGASLLGSGNIGTQVVDTSGPNALINNGTVSATASGTVMSLRFNSITNNATMSANRGILDFTNSRVASVVNNGTLSVQNGHILVNASTFTNNGTIDLSGFGILSVSGTYGIPSLGTINRGTSNSEVHLLGTLNLGGQTLLTNAAGGGAWTLDGLTVNSGTIAATAGVPLRNAGDTTLNGVTLSGNMQLGDSTSSGSITLANGSRFTGSLTIGSGLTGLRFASTAPLTGGTVTINGSCALQGDTNFVIPASATLDFNATASSTASPSLAGTAVTNNGTILVRGVQTYLTIAATNTTNNALISLSDSARMARSSSLPATAFTNLGTIRLRSEAQYVLNGTTTRAQLGTIDNDGGYVVIAGELDNRSSTLTLSSPGDRWRFFNGTIRGGDVVASGGVNDLLTPISANTVPYSTLIGVTLHGSYSVATLGSTPTEVQLRDSFGLDGTLSLQALSILRVSSSMTIASGTISGNSSSIICQSGQALTFGPSAALQLESARLITASDSPAAGNQITIRGSVNVTGGSSSVPSIISSPNLVTGGSIDLAPASFLSIYGASASIGGTIRMGASSSLKIDSGFGETLRLSPSLNLINNGGTIHLGGTIDNSGQTFMLTPTIGTVKLAGRILGGSVGAAPGVSFGNSQSTPFSNIPVTGYLDGVSLVSDMTVSDAAVGFVHACDFGGNTFSIRPSGFLSCPIGDGSNSPVSLSHGTLAVLSPTSGSRATATMPANGSLTLASDFQVTGGGYQASATLGSISNSSTPTTITNFGLIDASTSGLEFSIAANTVRNRGRMLAQNRGVLSILAGPSTTFDNTGGIVEAASGGSVGLSGNMATSALGTLRARDGGTIRFVATLQNASSNLSVTPEMGNVRFLGAILGGSISATGTMYIDAGTLSNITSITGELALEDRAVNVTGSLPLNGTLHLRNSAGISFNTARQFISSGTFLFEGDPTSPNTISGTGFAANDLLTLPASVTVRGGGGGLYIPTISLVKGAASIIADRPGVELRLSFAAYENLGLVGAINAGKLRITSPNTSALVADLRNTATMLIEQGSRVAVDDDFTQTATGSLRLLLGAGLPTNATAMLTADSLFLAGTLSLEVDPSHIPVVGYTAQLWTAREVSGTFDSVLGINLPANYYWDTSRLYATGSVTLVPAPGSLTALGLVAAAGVRRRHRKARS